MIKLYACLGSGNCMKPWLALNQLSLAFDLILIDVLKGEQKSSSFLAINPLGVVPFLITPDGQEVGESNAMLWYLAEGSPLMPSTVAERAEALQWLFFEQARLEPFISPARFFSHIYPQEQDTRPNEVTTWQNSAKPGLERLNTHLGTRTFMLASGYSIADIALFGYVHLLEEAGLTLDNYPNVARWISNVTETDRFRPLAHLTSTSQQAA